MRKPAFLPVLITVSADKDISLSEENPGLSQ